MRILIIIISSLSVPISRVWYSNYNSIIIIKSFCQKNNRLSLPERSNAQYLPKMGPYQTRKLSFNHYMFVHGSLNFDFRNMSIFNIYGSTGQHFKCYRLVSWESGFIDWLISYAIPDRIILLVNETVIIFTHK